MYDSGLGCEMVYFCLWWVLCYTQIFVVKLHKYNLEITWEQHLKLFQEMNISIIIYTNKSI